MKIYKLFCFFVTVPNIIIYIKNNVLDKDTQFEVPGTWKIWFCQKMNSFDSQAKRKKPLTH